MTNNRPEDASPAKLPQIALIRPETKPVYDERHGGPYDRGRADSWYSRPRRPHYFAGGTYNTPEIEEPKMTKAEIKAYNAGFDDGEASGDHKEW